MMREMFVPMQREGRAEEIANTVLFLCSDGGFVMRPQSDGHRNQPLLVAQARGCKKDCVNAVLKRTKIGEPNGNQERVDRRVNRQQRRQSYWPDGSVKELTKRWWARGATPVCDPLARTDRASPGCVKSKTFHENKDRVYTKS